MSLKSKKDILIGCDPEFFLYDRTIGQHVSAHGLVPGNKKEPYKLKDGAVQLDGTAVEFNINPTNCPREFEKNVLSVLGEIRKMIPKKYDFSFNSSVIYEERYFSTIPSECLVLGCEPDYSSTTGKMKVIPKLTKGSGLDKMRTGAGHIHIGWTSGVDNPHTGDHFQDAQMVCRMLNDYYYGNGIAYLWESKYDRRFKLYGSEGAFRPKSYGAEFRAFGNSWLKYPNLYKFISGYTQHLVYQMSLLGSRVRFIPYFGDVKEYCSNYRYYHEMDTDLMTIMPNIESYKKTYHEMYGNE